MQLGGGIGGWAVGVRISYEAEKAQEASKRTSSAHTWSALRPPARGPRTDRVGESKLVLLPHVGGGLWQQHEGPYRMAHRLLFTLMSTCRHVPLLLCCL